MWKKTNLTIFEKGMIINALAVSKLVFNAPILQNSTTEFLRTACTKVLNI